MSNEYFLKKEHLIAKIHIDDDNITENLCNIIEMLFCEKYKMDSDIYKQLQNTEKISVKNCGKRKLTAGRKWC